MSRYGRGPPPDTSNMVSLKVDNLTYRTSADDIEYLFEKYGKIGDVFIPKDRVTRESRGFAFVRFLSSQKLGIMDNDGRYSGFMTRGTPRTRWMLWTAACMMEETSGSKWLNMGDLNPRRGDCCLSFS